MTPCAKPLLKWAGGKTQLLSALAPFIPRDVKRYVEPMIGGGALFLALGPERALIADSNPELVNFYRAVVENGDAVLTTYNDWPFDEKTFYELRSLRYEELDGTVAAARLLYLNRGCFNGLYRVNRTGGFNVPWGRYKRRYQPDQTAFQQARSVLSRAQIELGDFRDVLTEHAAAGDFVFLDPPYVPVSEFSDFKRYTRVQFRDEDHEQMAALVCDLSSKGCEVLITNSNHDLVHRLYAEWEIEIVPTRRNVSSRGAGRSGEDVIIHVPAR